jgi:hypothetical protein
VAPRDRVPLDNKGVSICPFKNVSGVRVIWTKKTSSASL